MEKIKYISPQEAIEHSEPPQHRFDLIVDGERIGSAEIDYFSKPLPFYQLTSLYVDFKYKGKGYASRIMDQVEAWLRDKRKPGVLVDAIIEGDPSQGMYEKRGWKSVPESHGLHVYNWPEDIDISIIKGYPQRYTDREYRMENN